MSVNQREVYLLPFPIDNGTAPHPFIVLSVASANALENTFIGVMITSTPYKDDFSFELNDNMFDKKLDKTGCHVRMHLFTFYMNSEIIGRRLCTMKEFYFKQLMESIGDIVFGYSFKGL